MSRGKVIRHNYLRDFLIILLVIILIGTAVSALALYFNIQKPLDSHYSAILSIVTEVKESLIMKTLKINLVFYLLIATGVGVLTLLYTHRIAGPLYRIQMSTKAIAEGNLDAEIKLRRKDAINALAKSINVMTKHHAENVAMITSEVQQLRRRIEESRDLKEQNKDTGSLTKEISSLDKKIQDEIERIKL